MTWQFPWVSRRAYNLLDESLQRALRERDALSDAVVRLTDQIVNRFGFEPVSAPVRAELKEAADELKRYEESFQFDDASSGMISEEVLVMAKELGSK